MSEDNGFYDFKFEYFKPFGEYKPAFNNIQLIHNSGVYNLMGNVQIKLSRIGLIPVIVHSYISAN